MTECKTTPQIIGCFVTVFTPIILIMLNLNSIEEPFVGIILVVLGAIWVIVGLAVYNIMIEKLRKKKIII